MTGVALRDTGLALADLTALARAADDCGHSSIWLPEVGSRDALALAAILGPQTQQARIGTGVLPVYARNAVALALGAATAAEAARGRFILGLGAGHPFTAQSWFDATWTHPRARLREVVEVTRDILAGERVTHHGSFTVESFHLQTPCPPVPIYLAALTPASLRLAGEIADGVILNWLPPSGVERAALLVREAAADAGREVKVLAYVRAAAVEDEEATDVARRALREHTYAYVSLPAYANSLRQVGLGPRLDRLADGDDGVLGELTEMLCLLGDTDAIRDGVAAYGEAGLDDVIVYPVPYGDEPAVSVMRTVRAAASSVAAV